MPVGITNPWDTLLELQRELDNAMTSDWFGPATSSRGTYPPVNVFEQDGDLVAIAEVPGVPRDAIDIQVHRNELRLSGKKSIEFGEDASVHRRERVAGSFSRTLAMPFEVDPEGVKAECRDGILAIYLPRAERDKPRTISIS